MKNFFLIIGRSIRLFGYSIFLIILFYFLFAFLLSVIPTNTWNESEEVKTETVYLLTNGIHLDFVFRSEDLEKYREELGMESQHKYIGIGWGDKGFYLNTATWGDLEFETAFKAMFLRSETAIHISRYQSLNTKAIKVVLTKAQLATIIDYCISSFENSSESNFMKIETAGYFNNDSFYEAKGSYNCFKTCNEWVNIGLKKADVKTSVWSPFDKGILYHLEE